MEAASCCLSIIVRVKWVESGDFVNSIYASLYMVKISIDIQCQYSPVQGTNTFEYMDKKSISIKLSYSSVNAEIGFPSHLSHCEPGSSIALVELVQLLSVSMFGDGSALSLFLLCMAWAYACDMCVCGLAGVT